MGLRGTEGTEWSFRDPRFLLIYLVPGILLSKSKGPTAIQALSFPGLLVARRTYALLAFHGPGGHPCTLREDWMRLCRSRRWKWSGAELTRG